MIFLMQNTCYKFICEKSLLDSLLQRSKMSDSVAMMWRNAQTIHSSKKPQVKENTGNLEVITANFTRWNAHPASTY